MPNNKTKTYLSLFTPSAFSAVLSVFFAAFVIFLNQFSFIEKYLQLPDEFNPLQMFMKWLEGVLASTIGQGTTETVVVGAFWAVVGLGVYVFLKGIARFILEFGEGLDQRGYVWPKGTNRNRPLIEAAERTGFRIVAFIGLVIVFFWPLEKVVDGPVFVVFFGSNMLVRYIVWFAAIWITLHLCVILTRLVVLKPRLFN